jgi:hypothetical protein
MTNDEANLVTTIENPTRMRWKNGTIHRKLADKATQYASIETKGYRDEGIRDVPLDEVWRFAQGGFIDGVIWWEKNRERVLRENPELVK